MLNPKLHTGIDLNFPGGDAGQPVYAAATGTLVDVGKIGGNCSRRVVLEHENDDGVFSTVYMHIDPVLTSADISTPVYRGQRIGRISSLTPGQPCTGDHLHFGLYGGPFEDPGTQRGALPQQDCPPDTVFPGAFLDANPGSTSYTEEDLGLVLVGSCTPGPVRLEISRTTRGGRVEIYRGTGLGVERIGVGACSGTRLSLDNPVLVATTDPSDTYGHINDERDLEDCNDLFQVIDVSTCEVSKPVVAGYPPIDIPSELKLTAEQREQWDYFGAAVAFDGEHLVVGARGNAPGAAHIYSRSIDGSWTYVQELVPSNPHAEGFGHAVAIDAGRILVGAVDSGHASAYLFEEDTDGTWIEGSKIVVSEPGTAGWYHGDGVGLSGDQVFIASLNPAEVAPILWTPEKA